MPPTPSQQYDYIIAGSGCSGLSLLVHMIRSNALGEKKILLIDRELKTANDRTWCFWEEEAGPFEQLVSSSWQRMWFRSHQGSRLLDLKPYTYKLIRGIDFYRHCLSLIDAQPNITRITANIEQSGEDELGTYVKADASIYRAQYLFNSIRSATPALARDDIFLLQHFRGWFISTTADSFDPEEATLMDFRVSQANGTAFVYIMPFSKTEALVEYTLFSEQVLEAHEYESALGTYLDKLLQGGSYVIRETESGVIPMTNHRFNRGSGKIVNIGTAGGLTRGSTGYTFHFIQQHSAAIVRNLIQQRDPGANSSAKQNRFRFYDSVLLDVLANNTVPGDSIFSTMFMKNDPRDVLKFLDKESSLMTDLKIISSLPTMPFLKAGIKHL